VSRLVLVISDLYPGRQGATSLPRLACLEQWLARGHTTRLAAGWQQWVLDELLGGSYAATPWAAVAAAATAVAPVVTGHPWLATPVHLLVGIDTLRVHPAGLLHLDASEQQALVTDFARVFHDSGWSLHATGRREMLIASDKGLRAARADPGRWLGADPTPGLPVGPDASALQRLTSELEMWLHEHPVNRLRTLNGLLTVSGLWPWGGGSALAPARAQGAPAATPAWHGVAGSTLQVYGADLFLEGLCRMAGTASQVLPSSWPDHPISGDTLVHYTLGGTPDGESLQNLERDIIAPLTRQLYRGAADSLTLLVGERAVTLRRPGWRIWTALARHRPWWESLLAEWVEKGTGS
jgi:hypothetical protein